MTTGEIWQIVIGIFSIIASFGLSLFIYLRQLRTEKLVKLQDIENKVTSFIIENKEEISLLPLCIISNCLHKTDIHKTKIYTNFNKCSPDVQQVILKHEDVKDFKITQEEIDLLLDKFSKLATDYKMGKNMLYEGAKYFHRSYTSHQNEQLDDVNPFIFDNPVPSFFKDVPMDLFNYIDLFLGYQINPSKSPLNTVRGLYFDPPMDMLFATFNLGGCKENILCFWLMRYIISTCYVLSNHDLVKSVPDQELPILEEFNLKTFEDMYYYCIYMLRKTFLYEVNK